MERMLGGELSHHLGYPPGGEKPAEIVVGRDRAVDLTLHELRPRPYRQWFLSVPSRRCKVLTNVYVVGSAAEGTLQALVTTIPTR